MSSPAPDKRFSMIRGFHLADWFTLGNAVCGTGSLFSTISYVQSGNVHHLYLAGVLVFIAFLFDVLDAHRPVATYPFGNGPRAGFTRRCDLLRGGACRHGYGCGMQGLYDRVLLGYFVACGVSRLARFNVTAEGLSAGSGKVAYFEGTPIDTSSIVVAVLMVGISMGGLGDTLWSGE